MQTLTLTEPEDDDYIWKNFAYNEETCARDLRLYYRRSVRLDTLSGTNSEQTYQEQQAIRYYSNSSGSSSCYFTAQLEQTSCYY